MKIISKDKDDLLQYLEKNSIDNTGSPGEYMLLEDENG